MSQPDASLPVASRLPIDAVILKGGGVKGMAFAGAISVLQRYYDPQAFVGTSAGGIAAVLLAAGYTAEELTICLLTLDFRTFLDQSRWQQAKNLTDGYLHSGARIKEWIQSRLDEKLGKKADHSLASLPRRAVLYATKAGRGTLAFDGRGKRKETSADFAVRCTMSIPYFFQSQEHEGAEVWDGGLLNNFPVTAFKQDNPGTTFVGLYLGNRGRKTFGTKSRLGALFNAVLDRDDPNLLDDSEDIVVIDPSPVSTTNFSLSMDEKLLLLERGRLAAFEFVASKKLPGAPSSDEVKRARDVVLEIEQRVHGTRWKAKRGTRTRAALVALLVAFLVVLGVSPTLREWVGWAPLSSGDRDVLVSAVVGTRPGDPRPLAQVLGLKDPARQRTAELYKSAEQSVQTIAVHGSWIHDLAVQQAFGLALSRGVDVNLLVVDPKADGFKALEASALRGLERPDSEIRLAPNVFKAYFDAFRDRAKKFRNLSVRYYSAFPWIRLTIYDRKRAIFVFSPFLKPGNESIAYYSDDPWVVECLGRIFDQFKASSRAIASDEEYEALWNGLGVGAPRNGGSPHEGMASVPSGGLVTAR